MTANYSRTSATFTSSVCACLVIANVVEEDGTTEGIVVGSIATVVTLLAALVPAPPLSKDSEGDR